MRNVTEIVKDLRNHPERMKSDELSGLRTAIEEMERLSQNKAVTPEQLTEAK